MSEAKDDVSNLTPEQYRSVLDTLQKEKQRRVKEKVAAGEAVVVRVVVVNDQDPEAAKARAAATHLMQNPRDKAKKIFFEVRRVITGVPRAPDGICKTPDSGGKNHRERPRRQGLSEEGLSEL